VAGEGGGGEIFHCAILPRSIARNFAIFPLAIFLRPASPASRGGRGNGRYGVDRGRGRGRGRERDKNRGRMPRQMQKKPPMPGGGCDPADGNRSRRMISEKLRSAGRKSVYEPPPCRSVLFVFVNIAPSRSLSRSRAGNSARPATIDEGRCRYTNLSGSSA